MYAKSAKNNFQIIKINGLNVKKVQSDFYTIRWGNALKIFDYIVEYNKAISAHLIKLT